MNDSVWRQIKDIFQLLDFGEGYWGKVELTIQDGKVKLVEEKRTFKI